MVKSNKSKITPIKAPMPVGGGDFEPVPAGVYLARCYKMVDVGTQQVQFQNKAPQPTRQVYIWWEILKDDDGQDVRMGDGETPFSIFKSYTLSMHKKANLRADLENWRGELFTDQEADNFEITNLLDKYCKLQVVHRKSGERTYANVASIMTSKQYDIGVNEDSSFSIEDPDMEMFNAFPDWIKDKIRAAAEWKVQDGEANGNITPDGELQIEDVDDEPEKITKEELKKLPF